jgi:hypothetical protein
MITTDAWAFLNISHPVCAWAAYRGVLVFTRPDPGFLSIWTLSMIQSDDQHRIQRELSLEIQRAAYYPKRVSRLKGMYCFTDLRSAEQAMKWGGHFKPQYLAELSLAEARKVSGRLDSNWITFELQEPPFPPRALNAYWSGLPHPQHEPIWETLVEGRLVVLGTDLRERAYALVERYMPFSTAFLEASRVAAWAGSDLGNSTGWVHEEGDDLVFDYIMDMEDATNEKFLERLGTLRAEGHPMRPEAVQAFADDNVRLPDLRPLSFRRPKALLPFMAKASRAGPDQ